MMPKAFRISLIATILCGLIVRATVARACPFCNAQSQTLSEEMLAADVVAVARLTKAPERPDVEVLAPAEALALSKATFKIVEVLKGEDHIEEGKQIETFYFGENNKDVSYLLNGTVVPELAFNAPIPLSKKAEAYIAEILTLPESGPKRLAFFMQHLESEDPILAQDAFDEFAKSPFEDVQALEDEMDHDQLVAWINDTEVPPTRRRLYLMMLGVCGDESDVPMLEELMASEDREEKAGLDAIIGAYLTLRGEEGMKRVEELYLKNEEAEYVDTYAAVMAIRILGQESDVIPRDRLVEALRHVLDRAEYADLVIRDLARWEDWTVLDKLVEMFRKAEGPTIWIRDPVVQYVQVAMEEEGKVGQRATEAFAELKEIDAKAVERATAYGPAAMFAQSRASEADPPATGADGPAGDEVVEGSTDDAEQASTDDSPTEVAAVDTNDEAAAPNEGEATERADGDDGATAAIDEVPPTDTAEEGFLTSTVGVAAMIVVVAIVIFAMIWFLLRGFGRTSAPTARTGEPVS